MTRFIKRRLSRIVKDESGLATVEFVLVFPLFFTLLLSSLEAGFLMTRTVMLERGLDIVVRDIRLSTGKPLQHSELKTQICKQAAIIPDCGNTLKLEMQPVQPRFLKKLPDNADCQDRSEETQPSRMFVAGTDNELMLLRACVVVDPVFPTTGLGLALPKDSSGGLQITAVNAFVQEPR